MAAVWILTGHFAQLGTFLSKEDCRNHSMSSTVSQKYQLIILHAVAFCSEQSTYNLTHNPLCSCTRKRVKDVPMTCTNRCILHATVHTLWKQLQYVIKGRKKYVIWTQPWWEKAKNSNMRLYSSQTQMTNFNPMNSVLSSCEHRITYKPQDILRCVKQTLFI